MITNVLTKIFGSRNDRLLKQYSRTVARDQRARAWPAEALGRGAARQDRGAQAAATPKGATLDELLPEAFAVVREASKRTLRMRHFDVQLIGGMVLHYGKIAEMRTGEGKTLVATLPAYLNALTGKGVHIVTVNDYLAKRDAEWMGKIYRFLGLTVGVNLPHMEPDEKRRAYAADITYGTNNEFGFDYLRDNMAMHVEERFQRGLALRHRRRGRLDPDRRGAHAAHHLGPGRGPHRALPAASTRWRRCSRRRRRRRSDSRAGRLLGRREEPPGHALGGRARARRGDPGAQAGLLPRGREPLRAGQHHPGAPPVRGAARAPPLPPRPALRGAERRGHHRRRVHRPPDARAGAGPTACTRRSKRRKASRSRTRTRRSPRSPSRTTSACTGSSPA